MADEVRDAVAREVGRYRWMMLFKERKAFDRGEIADVASILRRRARRSIVVGGVLLCILFASALVARLEGDPTRFDVPWLYVVAFVIGMQRYARIDAVLKMARRMLGAETGEPSSAPWLPRRPRGAGV